MAVNMCFQGLVIVDFTNSNYPPLEIIGLVVSRSQVKTVEFLEKRDSRDGDMTEFPENRDSVVKGLMEIPNHLFQLPAAYARLERGYSI